jgi:hypothetical protein
VTQREWGPHGPYTLDRMTGRKPEASLQIQFQNAKQKPLEPPRPFSSASASTQLLIEPSRIFHHSQSLAITRLFHQHKKPARVQEKKQTEEIISQQSGLQYAKKTCQAFYELQVRSISTQTASMPQIVPTTKQRSFPPLQQHSREPCEPKQLQSRVDTHLPNLLAVLAAVSTLTFFLTRVHTFSEHEPNYGGLAIFGT